MCEWKDVGISHEFEKEDVAALFENWREVGRGVGEWEGGCGKGGVCGVGSSGIVFDCIEAICVDTLMFTYSSILFFNPLSF